MRPHPPSGIGITEAVASMGAVLSSCEDRLLLMSTIDAGGTVGRSECFGLAPLWPSRDVLVHLARRTGAPGILFGSRAVAGITAPAEIDVDLTRHLLAATATVGLELVEHVLFERGLFRPMKAWLSEDSL